MEMRQVRYALTVARERNFTRASNRLNVSQSAVSEQVKLLEQAIGFELFRRTGRGVEVTDAGRQFLYEAERVVNEVMNLADVARRLRGVGIDTISLGLASGLAPHFLPPLLAPHLVPPDVHLEIRTAPTRVLFQELQEERLDIGISVEVEHDRIPAGLTVSRMADVEMVLIARPDHWLAVTHAPVDLEALGDEPIIMSEPSLGYGQIVGRMFEDLGIRPRIRAVIDNIETMKVAVQAGAGVAIVPGGAADVEARHGLLAVLPIHPARHLTISAYRNRGTVSRRKGAILSSIIDAVDRP
jgi:DNA-binding transcriptional LysR family regulator